ncbi:MAG: hypothetical protein EON90_10985 [Brevundimonas sp.]|nr:MAG: hypothetical protein EON90_10985 [Brevundimonas sp.]
MPLARPRRTRRLSERAFIRTLQLVRLEGLESGEYEPMSSREEMYLRALRQGARVDIEDFVISPSLLLLESVERRAREADAAAGEPT